MTWDDVLEAYVAHLESRHWSPASVRSQRKALKRFFLFAWRAENGMPSPVEVTAAIVEGYQRYLTEPHPVTGRRIAESTRQVYLQAVKAFYAWLEVEGKVLVSPAAGVDISWKRDRQIGTVLTEKDAAKLVETPDVSTPLGIRNRAILELFYSTGLRLNELVVLTIYDVDLVAGVVRVREGKGKKDRTVPLGKTAAYYLTEYVTNVRTRYAKKKRLVTTALFLNQKGEAITTKAVVHLVRKAAKEAGIKASPHALRRSMATHLLAHGAEPELVQQMLGHSSGNSLRFYARLFGPELKAEHERTHPRETEGREPEGEA